MRSVSGVLALGRDTKLFGRLLASRSLWGPGVTLAAIVLAIVLYASPDSQIVLFRYNF